VHLLIRWKFFRTARFVRRIFVVLTCIVCRLFDILTCFLRPSLSFTLRQTTSNFVSDMPGGMGGKDIWRGTLKETGWNHGSGGD